MKITAAELKELGVIEKVIPEREPVTVQSLPDVSEYLDAEIEGFLKHWCGLDETALIKSRYWRFRNF